MSGCPRFWETGNIEVCERPIASRKSMKLSASKNCGQLSFEAGQSNKYKWSFKLSQEFCEHDVLWNVGQIQAEAGKFFFYKRLKSITVFPRIVSAETILFWVWPCVLWPLITVHKSEETIQVRKLFKWGNYSSEETIQGQKLFAEIRYLKSSNLTFIKVAIHLRIIL